MRKINFIATVAFILVLFSSCNRGVGCPSNFSISEGVQNILEFIGQLF